jgi:hypothetical protein
MTRTAFLVLSATLLASPSLRGQTPAALDQRWSGWLGCWTPAATSRADAATQVCIVPAPDGQGVRMVTFAGDTEVLDETMVADGSPRPAAEKDCTGARSIRWAARGPRLFSSSTLTCSGQPDLRTSGILSLVAADRWMDVQVIVTGGREQVRTRRFWRSSAAPPAPVDSFVRSLAPAHEAVQAPSADDVIEASANMPSVGVEAWLAESGARVPIDRHVLVQLSTAHVSANVIDLMIALAFPKKFEVHRTSSGGAGVFGVSGGGEDFISSWSSMADVYGFGLGCFSSPYCFGYGDYYPGDGWYFEPGGGGGGGSEPPTHGQVVNGYGYTRVQPREGDRVNTGQRGGNGDTVSGGSSSDSGGGGSASSSGGSDSSGASPAGYSGGGGASTGLTAVPR